MQIDLEQDYSISSDDTNDKKRKCFSLLKGGGIKNFFYIFKIFTHNQLKITHIANGNKDCE